MKSIASKFLLPVGLTIVALCAVLLWHTESTMRATVQALMDDQAKLALEFDLAIRDYVAEEVRPAMAALLPEDAFDPTTMSTSYVARRIFERVRARCPEQIIRFASDNPRNPANQASTAELEIIDYFNQHPDQDRWSGTLNLDGQPCRAQFQARRMTAECLRCHGDPAAAPASMIAQYGDQAGFHRPVGTVIALDTVGIPLERIAAAHAERRNEMLTLLAVGLAVLFLGIVLAFRTVVARRLIAIGRHFEAAAAEPDVGRIRPIPICGRDEIGRLARSFNVLAARLRASHATLEDRVAERTLELETTNSELQAEMAENESIRSDLAWEARVNGAIADLSRALLASLSIDEISQQVLEVARHITGSRHGFVGYIAPETGHLVVPAMTLGVWEDCRMPDKQVEFDRFGGLWGAVLEQRRPILTNEPARHPDASGTPPGHVPIDRFISAPALAGDLLVGQIALANAPNDFTERDVALLERLAAIYAVAVQRKRHLDALHSSEQRLELALTGTDAGLWDCDMTTGHVRCEGAWYHTLGFDDDTLPRTSDQWNELVHPDDRAAAHEAAQRHIDGQTDNMDNEVRVRTPRGDWVWIHARGRIAARDPDGKPTRLVGTHTDVTVRKQLEEAEREQARFLQCLLDTVPNAICYLDTAQRFVGCNDAFARWIGRPRDQIVTCTVFDIFPREVAEKMRDRDAELLRTGNRQFFEDQFGTNDDGSIRDVLFHRATFAGPDGQVAGIVSVATNISAQKQVERQLRFADFTLNNAADTILWIGPDSSIIEANNAASRNLGYSREELLNLTIPDIDAAYDARSWGKVWSHLRAAGKCCLESRHVRKDGTSYPVEVNVAHLEFEGQEFGCALVRDVSAREAAEHELRQVVAQLVDTVEREKRTHQQLKAARERAEDATRTKSEFLANMSHEIRTPMTAIVGFAELMAEDSRACDACTDCGNRAAHDRHAEYINTIRANGRHLLEIINDILDLSKIEAGRLAVECIPCSVVDLLAGLSAALTPRAADKGLDLVVDLAGPVPETIQTDPTRLRQILFNLVGNAIKFTERGQVSVTARLLQAGDEPQLQIDVVDTGIGISDESQERLFQPFVQADSSTTRRFGGTGLGLTVSKSLAERLGGTITVESTLGTGSRFSVTISTGPLDGVPLLTTLPRQSASDQPARDAKPEPLSARILLAEDGPDNQRLLMRILTAAGASVELAQNGQEAVLRVRQANDAGQPFDVILMDMQMPVLDGYAATRRLRNDGHTGPIIALTAHAMDGDRDKCLAAGCNEFCTKPVNRRHLLDTLRAALQGRRNTAADNARPAQ
jgi:PAS domain S-box-containing protein